jgi:hypothetical protein
MTILGHRILVDMAVHSLKSRCWSPFSGVFSTWSLRILQRGRMQYIPKALSSTERPQLTALQVTFLGTASAQPSSTRNHSSLALHLGGDVWLFDCGEATQHQLQKSIVKMGKIEKIFITHTHGESNAA